MKFYLVFCAKLFAILGVFSIAGCLLTENWWGAAIGAILPIGLYFGIRLAMQMVRAWKLAHSEGAPIRITDDGLTYRDLNSVSCKSPRT